MQREFQIGDRVRIISCYASGEPHVGKTGIVVSQYEDGDLRVDIGEKYECVAIKAELIEPAKPHRFKVGDRVRIVDGSSAHAFASISKPLNGKIGVVRIDIDSDGEYTVRLDANHDWGWVKPEGLELIEVADEPERSSNREDAYAEMYRQMMSIQTPPMFGQWLTTEPKPSSANGIMGRVKTLARKLLDKDTQSLIEAGVLTNDLSVRDSDFVLSFLVNQYKKELAVEARAKIKAERDEDED